MTSQDKFTEKGHSILKGSAYSMRDFIEDKPSKGQMHKDTSAQRHSTAKPQIHSEAKPQMCKVTNEQNCKPEALVDAVERIHVQIRKDLADRLIQMVYSRKLSKKRASQRSIIEQALEEFFERNNL
jgi:hypothetical protein